MQQINRVISSSTSADNIVEHRMTEQFILSKAFPIFVSHHNDYYKKRFLLLEPIMKKQTSRAFNQNALMAGGFNLSAALFSCWWMAYRRMYLPATIFMLIEFGALVLLGRHFDNVFWLFTIVNICVGLIGNSMYFKHCNIQLVNCHTYEEYKQKGGTSPVSCLSFITLSIFVCLISDFAG